MYCRKTPRSINAQNVLFWIRMWTTLAIWFQQLVDFDQSCIKNGILSFWNDKLLDWQKHWNGNTKVQTIAEWMWLQNSNNIVAILRQLEQSILSIAAKILETLALSILLSFTPNHELEHWAVGGSSEILNIFDEAGKIFFLSEFCFNVAANGCYDANNILPLKLISYISTNPQLLILLLCLLADAIT